jgi:hypothetical protein
MASGNLIFSNVLTNLKSPEQFDNASKLIDPEVISDKVNIFTDITKYVELLNEYIQLGVDHIYIYNVNLNQKQFIEDFGQKVLPFVMD